MRSICREIFVAIALTGVLAAAPAAAREMVDYTSELAIAIAAAPDPDAAAAAVATYEIGYGLGPEQIAQAFGEAASLCDLGRCANPNAVVAAFANYKQGKDAAVLDAAFAAGHAGTEIEAATANGELFQDSFVALASPGDPPSGQ